MKRSRNPQSVVRRAALLSLLMTAPLFAAEYFVALDGDDTRDGRSREQAFATVQRGVDALEPGDTLTILPGEYFESVSHDDLGSPDAETLIRADVPGSVILRGDVPAPRFEPVDGYRHVHAAAFDREPQAVLEHDTLRTLFSRVNVSELEFDPGHFYYDAETQRLYISTTDLRPPSGRRYTVAVSGKTGLTLQRPRRVTIDGLAFTGYYDKHGIFLGEPVGCTVRNVTAYLNTAGIMLAPVEGLGRGDGGSDNRVVDCVAYGNTFAGIVRYGAHNDVIERNLLYRNVRENREHFGIMHYGGMTGPLILQDNISFGHNFNLSVKPHSEHVQVRRNVALGFIRNGNLEHNLIGGGNEYDRDGSRSPADNILFRRERDLDPDFEFADPLNLDYRLQPDSRFRGTAPDGSDRGPYPYAPNIFYISPAGDDTADGLSTRAPWQTLERALPALRPGDTLYLAGGTYDGATWNAPDAGEARMHIRGRGRDAVVFTSPLHIEGGNGITLERLHFAAGLNWRNAREVALKNCTFYGNDGLSVDRSETVDIRHSVFVSVPLRLRRSTQATLSGNLFDNTDDPALHLDRIEALRYADYNVYADGAAAWRVGRRSHALDALQPAFERHARVVKPEFSGGETPPRLRNAAAFANAGPHSKPAGVHLPYADADDALTLQGPFLHSVSDTTANFEWWSSQPATHTVRWGAGDNRDRIERIQSPNRFSAFSLTDLTPGATYSIELEGADTPVTFATLSHAPDPQVYYVAPDGDDAAAGTSRARALRTVNRAAVLVGPGDTVRIAGGEYAETVRIRAAGTEARPITFEALPGEAVVFRGASLSRAFELSYKPDIRFDGLQFQGFGDAVFVFRHSPRGHVIRCLNAMVSAAHSPGMVIRNNLLRGGWTTVGLDHHSFGSRVEHNVFLSTTLRFLSIGGGAEPSVVRNNIFRESIRNKTHQNYISLRAGTDEGNNCFYLRWPEDERLVINNRPLSEIRVRTGTDSIAANPMMAGVTGTRQGWPQARVESFADVFTGNPGLILRGIGLETEAFAGFAGVPDDWPFTRDWAERVVASMRAAQAHEDAGRHDQALAAWLNLVETHPLPERLEAEALDRAALCAEALGDHDHALELAERIPIRALSARRRMRMLYEREQFEALIETFKHRPGHGRMHLNWSFPELEDVMLALYHYRGMAYAKTGDLEAAEADLKLFNAKKRRLSYRSGEAFHDLARLQLGDFYRDYLQDEDKALEAYRQVIDRTAWTFWGRPRKPAARGADDTLVKATEAAIAILQQRGETDAIPELRYNLLLAQAEAAAAVLDTETLLARFRAILAMPGREPPPAGDLPERLERLPAEARRALLDGLADALSELQRDTRTQLIAAAVEDDAGTRADAMTVLLALLPHEAVRERLDAAERDVREQAERQRLTPKLERMRQQVQAREWQALVAEFGETDFDTWELNRLAGEALRMRGQAHNVLDNATQAATDLRRSVARHPGDAFAWHLLGEVYRQSLDDPEQALAAYREAHRRTGVNYGWLSLSVALNTAALLQASGNPDDALELLQRYDPEQAAGGWGQRLENAIAALKE